MNKHEIKNVVIWGTGKYGELAYEEISTNPDYKLLSVCDMDKSKVGMKFHMCDITHPMEIIKLRDYDMLVLCINKWEEAYTIARSEMYIPDEKIYIWDGSKIISKEETYPIIIHSQDGEELFLQELFGEKKEGLYVDVGAYHPVKFSNTLWAYKRGWRGINIEPNINNIKLFEMMRPDDINVNVGISDQEAELDYYQFEEGGINTFDKSRANYLKQLGYEIKGVTKVPIIPLQKILDRYGVEHIDFLDIDVEEHEMNVLRGLDLSKVDIDYILIEQLSMDLEMVVSSDVAIMLRKFGYHAISKFDRTVVYEKR